MFKIVDLIRDSERCGDTPETADSFFGRIETVAETYAKAGWKIVSLSLTDEETAILFMQEPGQKEQE